MTKKGLIVFVLVALLAVGAEYAIKMKNKGVSSENVELLNQQTYEQGLWDGFNRTMEYLNTHHYLVDDTIKIEITEVDSVLHSTKK